MDALMVLLDTSINAVNGICEAGRSSFAFLQNVSVKAFQLGKFAWGKVLWSWHWLFLSLKRLKWVCLLGWSWTTWGFEMGQKVVLGYWPYSIYIFVLLFILLVVCGSEQVAFYCGERNRFYLFGVVATITFLHHVALRGYPYLAFTTLVVVCWYLYILRDSIFESIARDVNLKIRQHEERAGPNAYKQVRTLTMVGYWNWKLVHYWYEESKGMDEILMKNVSEVVYGSPGMKEFTKQCAGQQAWRLDAEAEGLLESILTFHVKDATAARTSNVVEQIPTELCKIIAEYTGADPRIYDGDKEWGRYIRDSVARSWHSWTNWFDAVTDPGGLN